MKTTFILAQHFNVTPFEIMAQEIDAVIMVVNYLIDSGNASDKNVNNTINEREQDAQFWACL